MSAIPESTHSTLVFSGYLPLSWRELPSFPEATELQHIEQTNLHILHTLFALDIHAGDYGDDPSLLSSASELKRLDFKVSVLLEMVGALLAGQQAIPTEHQLTLAVTYLSWHTETPPPHDVPLRLELYCNFSYPRPLILHGYVDQSLLAADAMPPQTRIIFHPPSEPLQEALERYIFLRHRRMIANRRGNSQR